MNLLWVDFEMTGLDVEKEVILELAAIVTDLQFAELAHYHAIIYQPREYLDRMDDWNKTHHKSSGLLEKIQSGKKLAIAEQELLTTIAPYFTSKDKIILAGNSIGQDRLFINKYMKTFADRLHYRMLDVSSWKIIFREKYKISYDKKNNHRAVDDIRESIAEMQHYLKYIKPEGPSK